MLQGYNIDWFGFSIGGNKDRFLFILNDVQADDELKSEAAHAFCRLPRISDRAAQIIYGYLDSPIAEVRCGILATIETFKLGNGDAVARLLEDSAPNVRKQAMSALVKLESKKWTGAVLKRLREDSNPEVVFAAFFNLKKAGALDKQELLQIVEQSPLGNLRSQAAHIIDWSKEDIPLLIRMLCDSNLLVRLYATFGLRKLKARNSLPQLLELLSKEKEAHLVGSILKMLGELQDRSTVPVLLEWAENEDDFHRLDAIDALIKIGDERVVPIVRSMLNETRCPQRRNDDGGSMSSGHSIGTLVRKSLNESPNQTLRNMSRSN